MRRASSHVARIFFETFKKIRVKVFAGKRVYEKKKKFPPKISPQRKKKVKTNFFCPSFALSGNFFIYSLILLLFLATSSASINQDTNKSEFNHDGINKAWRSSV